MTPPSASSTLVKPVRRVVLEARDVAERVFDGGQVAGHVERVASGVAQRVGFGDWPIHRIESKRRGRARAVRPGDEIADRVEDEADARADRITRADESTSLVVVEAEASVERVDERREPATSGHQPLVAPAERIRLSDQSANAVIFLARDGARLVDDLDALTRRVVDQTSRVATRSTMLSSRPRAS